MTKFTFLALKSSEKIVKLMEDMEVVYVHTYALIWIIEYVMT